MHLYVDIYLGGSHDTLIIYGESVRKPDGCIPFVQAS